MNKRLFHLALGLLLLLAACSTQKESPAPTQPRVTHINRMGSKRNTKLSPQTVVTPGTSSKTTTKEYKSAKDKSKELLDSIMQAIPDTVTLDNAAMKRLHLDTTSRRIIIEPPHISADSLAMIRELWDSIVNDPFLGCYEITFIDEQGNETKGWMHDDYGVILIKTVNTPPRSINNKTAKYWTGSKALPANYMTTDSIVHLYQWIDNMPEFFYKGGDRDFDDAMNAFKPRLGLSKGRHTVVRFVVESDGTVSNAHIIKSHSPREDYFATVIATYLLKFTPPTHQGKPCRIVYQLPL